VFSDTCVLARKKSKRSVKIIYIYNIYTYICTYINKSYISYAKVKRWIIIHKNVSRCIKLVEFKGWSRRPETNYNTQAECGTNPISMPLVNKPLAF
jgi:hypothetical protein